MLEIDWTKQQQQQYDNHDQMRIQIVIDSLLAWIFIIYCRSSGYSTIVNGFEWINCHSQTFKLY